MQIMKLGGKLMTSRINVTAMMCEYANESGTQINNVFDTIKLGEDNKASFYIVMNVNTINYELNNFYFTFAIEKINRQNEDNMVTILQTLEIEAVSIDENFVENHPEQRILMSTIPNSGQSTLVYKVSDKEFPGVGKYELQIYMFDKIGSNGIGLEQLIKDKIVCTYCFEII